MSPGFDDGLDVGQTREPMLVEALIAETPVERFDIGVLIRFARFDQTQRDAALVGPRQHGASAELRAIIGTQDARQAPLVRQVVECTGDGDAPEGTRRDDGHRLGRRIVDNGQALHRPPLGGAVEDEIGGPNLVRCRGPAQRVPLRDRDLLPSSAPHLELGVGVQALDALVVDLMAFLPQLQIDPPGE